MALKSPTTPLFLLPLVISGVVIENCEWIEAYINDFKVFTAIVITLTFSSSMMYLGVFLHNVIWENRE